MECCECLEKSERKTGERNAADTFDILMTHGNQKLAVRYAKRIIKEHKGLSPTDIAPGTKVYELVEELAKYLPEELQSIILTNRGGIICRRKQEPIFILTL